MHDEKPTSEGGRFRTCRTAKRMDTKERKRHQFLETLALTGNVVRSCRMASLPRQTAYDWRKAIPGFAEAWDDAKEMGTDALEDEAIRRAHQGLARKKFYKGVPIIDPETGEQYVEREYSDNLLMFMLKARRPDKFKDRSEPQMSGQRGISGIQVMPTKSAEESMAVHAAR
jgi:hypothetical protein